MEVKSSFLAIQTKINTTSRTFVTRPHQPLSSPPEFSSYQISHSESFSEYLGTKYEGRIAIARYWTHHVLLSRHQHFWISSFSPVHVQDIVSLIQTGRLNVMKVIVRVGAWCSSMQSRSCVFVTKCCQALSPPLYVQAVASRIQFDRLNVTEVGLNVRRLLFFGVIAIRHSCHQMLLGTFPTLNLQTVI